MSHKVLNIEIGKSWTSYIASVAGVLSAAGWWQDEIYELMGMTGMAFHFIMHREACPSSVTVYDWPDEHLTMMDRVGVYSEAFQVFNDPTYNTFNRVRETAIRRIKGSIDRGVGVVLWAPTPLLEFGLITGYDDEDGVFFIESHNPGEEADPLLYSNLGKSEVPVLFYQIFHGRVPVDPEKVYRNSLEFGAAEWNKEFHQNPAYASGRKAYDNLLSYLKQGSVNFGLSYNLIVYADAKRAIARYLESVKAGSRELTIADEAVSLYRQVADNFRRLTDLAPFPPPENAAVDKPVLAEIIRLVEDSRAKEDKAMQLIATALHR